MEETVEVTDQAPCLVDDCLTPRERDVTRCVALGLRTAHIAQRLGMSPRTVKVHVHNIFGKLGIRTRHELVGYALRVGIV